MEFTTQGRQCREGVLSASLNLEFSSAIKYLQRQTQPYISNDGQRLGEVHRLLSEFEGNIGVCLQRVTAISMSLGVAELQRNWLSSIAVLDFIETIQRRMDIPVIAPGVVEHCMGAYVWDDKDVLKLFNASLLVYYIRLFNAFDRQIVQKVQPAEAPPVCMKVAAPLYLVTLVSCQAGSEEKFAAIRAASISCFHTPSPFQNMHLPGAYSSSYSAPGSSTGITKPAESSSSMMLSLSVGPICSSGGRVASQSAPYTKQPPARSRGKKPALNHESPHLQRDPFEDLPTTPLLPLLVESWKGANRAIEVEHPSARHNSGTLPKLVTIVPDPAVVFGTSDEGKQRGYLKQWAHFRKAWARRCADPANTCEPISSKVWKNVLGLVTVGLWRNGQTPTTRQQRDHQEASNIVWETMSKYDPGVPLTPLPSTPELEVSACREIIHELVIVNFWYQLTALDRVANDSTPKPSPRLSSAELAVHTVEHHTRHLQLIQTVFGASTDPFAASDLLFVEGFAAASWSLRVPALLAFW
ncbi:hypothetical protein PQX77_002571 [Marasmius sp. AFHP31]|nr:hypothetical protein PQX77_002571 [Marasmius sp. AFHP31]